MTADVLNCRKLGIKNEFCCNPRAKILVSCWPEFPYFTDFSLTFTKNEAGLKELSPVITQYLPDTLRSISSDVPLC